MSNAASWWRTLLADDRDGARLIVEHIEALATIKEASVQRNLLKELVRDFVSLEARVDSLLNNTLPPSVAEEVKLRGRFEPRQYNCSILFTDLVRFTALAELDFWRRDDRTQPNPVGQLFWHHELAFRPVQGLELVVTEELWDPDIDLTGNVVNRVGFGFDLFPWPYTEITVRYRYSIAAEGHDWADIHDLMTVLHFFL